MQQISTQINTDRTEKSEQSHERQTNLSKELKRNIAVIPDIQIQPFVYNNSGNEFTGSNKYHTSYNLNTQGDPAISALPWAVQNTRHNPQGQTSSSGKTPGIRSQMYSKGSRRLPKEISIHSFFHRKTSSLLYISIHSVDVISVIMHPVCPVYFSTASPI